MLSQVEEFALHSQRARLLVARVVAPRRALLPPIRELEAIRKVEQFPLHCLALDNDGVAVDARRGLGLVLSLYNSQLCGEDVNGSVRILRPLKLNRFLARGERRAGTVEDGEAYGALVLEESP